MGVYLNPGNESFRMALNSEIYVDKTGMIRYLNTLVGTKQRYVSVSRPRRFGKTTAADMIGAYYDRTADSRELFERRKLTECETFKRAGGEELSWDACLGKYDVLRLVMTRFFKEYVPAEQSLSRLQRLVFRDFRKAYPTADYFDEENLLQTIEDAYAEEDRQIVIIIDEWDAVFRARPMDKDGQKLYLDFLRDLLKDNEHIALAYMTGILPIKKYGQHSALNMFDEYSMMAPMQLAPFTGFTEGEVKELCAEFEMGYGEISDWYDGYLVSDRIPIEKRKAYRQGDLGGCQIAIYSPESVVKAMHNGYIRNYWNKTETYEALAEYIRMDYDGLKDAVALLMDGGRLKIDTSTYQNDMTTFHSRDDVLSLLIHLGYLGYDDERGEVFIPNREILAEFKTSTKSEEWTATFRAFAASQKLLEATWAKDEAAVAEYLEDAHNQAGNRTYNDEAALSYGIRLAYYAAQKYYTTVLELDSGKGYADIAYLPSPKYPNIPALLVELKYNKNVETALSQIKRQRYDERLEHYKGNILLVAIDYDRRKKNTSAEFKHHKCRIEEA